MPPPREQACAGCGEVRVCKTRRPLARLCRRCSAIARNTSKGKQTSEERRQWLRDWRERNREAVRAHGIAYRAQARLEALQAYGGKCQHCGEADPVALVLDHIHDDGNHERRRNGRGGYKLALELRRAGWPQGRLQVLCHNCNYRKELARRQRAQEATHGKTKI